jgi:hypothetical protein
MRTASRRPVLVERFGCLRRVASSLVLRYVGSAWVSRLWGMARIRWHWDSRSGTSISYWDLAASATLVRHTRTPDTMPTTPSSTTTTRNHLRQRGAFFSSRSFAVVSDGRRLVGETSSIRWRGHKRVRHSTGEIVKPVGRTNEVVAIISGCLRERVRKLPFNLIDVIAATIY